MIPARLPAPPPPPLRLSKLLVVEGFTPLHFFEALLQNLGLATQIEIRSFGGVGDLRAFVKGLASSTEFQRLVRSVGIVRDAELDAAAARQSAEDSLRAAGLTPVPVPPVKTSIFILPDNVGPGMIETLCMDAVRSEPAAWKTSSPACAGAMCLCPPMSRLPSTMPRLTWRLGP